MVAIDPGPEQSAIVVYEPVSRNIDTARIDDNERLRAWLNSAGLGHDWCVIEMIASYGMAVGKNVFETAFWVGRFYEAAIHAGMTADRVYRSEVKMHLCHSMRAKDANIRAALIDLFPKTGRDSKKRPSAIGTRKCPGPLFGIHDDLWAALAVAVTWAERGDVELPPRVHVAGESA